MKVEIEVAGEPRAMCVEPADIAALNWIGLLEDGLRGTTMEDLDLQSRAEIARLFLRALKVRNPAIRMPDDADRQK